MTTLNARAEMLSLIQNREFQSLLDIHSKEMFEARSEEPSARLRGYYAGKWDEECSGVTLFDTPKRGNNCGSQYGTWLTVARVFGDNQLPFCVQAAEYSPMGIEIDIADVGRFKTLGEALDCAFDVHEQGRIELVQRTGLPSWLQGSGHLEVSGGEVQPLSAQALAVNFAMEDIASRREERQARQQEQSRLQAIRLKAPVCIQDAPKLLASIKERLGKTEEFYDNTSSHIQIADSINRHFFNDEGHLFECSNDDLKKLSIEWDGTAFVAMESGADLIYINHDGVFNSWELAEQSLVSNLTTEYKPEQEVETGLSFCRINAWPFEGEYQQIDLGQNSSIPIRVLSALPEDDVDDPCPPMEVVIDRVVAGVVREHKLERERQLRKALKDEGLEF